MPIKIKCLACSNALTVPDSYAGKRGKCPKCGEQIKIPVESEPEDKVRIQVGEPENQQESISGIPNFADQDIASALSAPSISVPATSAPDLSAPPTAEAENPFAVTPRKKRRKVNSAAKVAQQPSQLTSSKLRQVGVLSVAMTVGMIYAVLGLILGLLAAGLMVIVAIIGISAAPQVGGDLVAFGGTGLFMLVFYPIMLGAGGFIGGALLAFLYNLAAKLTGGVELRFGE